LSKQILKEITDHICTLDQDGRVQLLLTFCLGRLFMKAHAKGENWQALATSIDERHIADWLRASVTNNASWLSNLDELGRPKKLMKFGNVEQVSGEAHKAMVKANQAAVGHVADGEKFVMEVGGGMYIVQLLTPEALDYESSKMQHCVGNGGYDEAMAKNERHFFSLRSGIANPHVTIDIDVASGWVNEMKGKQNSHPDDAYLKALAPFFKSRPELRFLRNTGLLFDQHRNLVHIRSLPDGTVLEGDLRINGGGPLTLPKNLTVKGDMEITFVDKLILSDNLNIGGTFLIEGSVIKGRIENLVVEGWSTFFVDVKHDAPSFLGHVKCEHIGFCNTQMTELPEMEITSLALEDMPISDISQISALNDLSFLRLNKLPNVVKLPTPPNIEKLELFEIDITDYASLPMASDIVFSKMKIGVLPDNLSVPGTLTFSSCEIAALPSGLSVGDLAFINMPAPDFPSDLVITASTPRSITATM
jgi:hypothetical protein